MVRDMIRRCSFLKLLCLKIVTYLCRFFQYKFNHVCLQQKVNVLTWNDKYSSELIAISWPWHSRRFKLLQSTYTSLMMPWEVHSALLAKHGIAKSDQWKFMGRRVSSWNPLCAARTLHIDNTSNDRQSLQLVKVAYVTEEWKKDLNVFSLAYTYMYWSGTPPRKNTNITWAKAMITTVVCCLSSERQPWHCRRLASS
jgi:hypothetical protein